MTNILKGIVANLRKTEPLFPFASTPTPPQRTSILRDVAITLKETEDMFPGIGPSAFDEHNTTRTTKLSAYDELDRLDKYVTHLNSLLFHHETIQRQIRTKMQNGDILQNNYTKNIGDKAYKEVPNMGAQYPLAFKELEDYYFNSKGPEFPNIRSHIAKLDHVLGRLGVLEPQMKKLKTKASTIRRKATAIEIKRQKDASSSASIPDTAIPKTFAVKYYSPNTGAWTSKNVDNPYFSAYRKKIAISSYAGHPAHFAWKGREKTTFFLLSKLVKELGLPELDVMYYKTFNKVKFPAFYMANADKSFQLMQGDYGAKKFYMKDALKESWGKYLDADMMTDVKSKIRLVADRLARMKKKP